MASELAGRLLKGGAWAAGTRLIGMAATLALYALLARLLSPAEMGNYFLIMSIVGVLSTLVLFGMPQVAVRMIASSTASSEQLKKNRDVLFKISLFVLVSSIMVFLLLLTEIGERIFEFVLNSSVVGNHAVVIGLLVASTALLSMVAEFFRGFHDIRMASILGGVATSIVLVVLLVLLWVAEVTGLANVTLVTLLASACVLVIAGPLFLPYWKNSTGNKKLSFKCLLNSAWPIAVFNLAVVFSAQGVLWIVSSSMSEHDVAIYGSVLRIVAMLTITHTLLVAASQSSMAELFAINDIQRLQKLVRAMSSVTFLIGLLAMLFLIVGGKEILGTVFGDFYKAGYELLLIMGGFYVVGIYFGATGMLLMMTGHSQSLLWVMVLTIICRFVLAYFLADAYGMIGVAAAWGLGDLMQNFFAWLLVRKKIRIVSHADFDFKFIKKSILNT